MSSASPGDSDVLKLVARRILKHPVITRSVKGFALAYLYIILPRFLSIVSRAIKHKERSEDVIAKMVKALKRACLPNRFPWFIAKLVAGVFILDPVLNKGVQNSTLMASFLSGLFAFNQYKDALKTHPKGDDTTDLTLTVMVRAVDMLVRKMCRRYRVSPRTQHLGDVALFTGSCFVIMFCWFYYPQRLPPSYRRWITTAANMDDELVEALRLLRNGEIIYGERGPHDDILDNMCSKHGVDPRDGHFSASVPLPCRVVHNGIEGCEAHAAWRWSRGFLTALPIYLPINLAVALFAPKWTKAWKHALASSARSSAFLATFITLNWYGVCLVRTRLGPKLFPKATPQQLEDTYGPGLGSALCGLSSLIEYPKRRGELGLFVTPRALSACIPEGCHTKHQYTESLAFAASFAVLVSGVVQNPDDVRGVFRKLMSAVF